MYFLDSYELTYIDSVQEEFICWFKNDKLEIYLTGSPFIQTRNCNKYIQSKEEYASMKRWPHLLVQDLSVQIIVTDMSISKLKLKYAFKICKNYCFDGATIPRIAWRLIGAPSDPRFIVGALIHDVLCQHKEYINNDRKLASEVLEKCCMCTGTNWITRKLIFLAVEIYQIWKGGW